MPCSKHINNTLNSNTYVMHEPAAVLDRRVPCAPSMLQIQDTTILPGLDGGADHAAELLLERVGAQEEAGMSKSVIPNRPRGISITTGMLPEQALKRVRPPWQIFER